jgi:hypothetical protein
MCITQVPAGSLRHNEGGSNGHFDADTHTISIRLAG